MTLKVILGSLACLLWAAPLAAQEGTASEPPELITDRPDQTESAETVPPGLVQVETGWVFAREDAEGVRLQTHQVPGTRAPCYAFGRR